MSKAQCERIIKIHGVLYYRPLHRATVVPDWGPTFVLLRELFFNLIYSVFNYILKMHRK